MKMRSVIVMFIVGIFLFLNCSRIYAQQDIQWEKSISRVRMLVEKRPELLGINDNDFRSAEGNNLLSYVMEDDEYNRNKLQLLSGININYQSDDACRLLCAAAQYGDNKTILFLLSNGVDVNCYYKEEDSTPLFESIYAGKPETVALLLRFGAYINVRDDQRRTPLLLLGWSGTYSKMKPEIVNKIAGLLISSGAEINVQDSHWETPLHLFNNYNETIKLLIKNGADVRATDKKGRLPIHRAAEMGGVEAIKIYLDMGIDVNVRDSEGMTPLHIVTSNYSTPWSKRFEIIDILMKNDADLNKKDTHENTPLYYAVETGDEKLVEVLLSYGAKSNIVCAAGDTPLTLAMKLGRYDMAKRMMIKMIKKDWTVKGFVLAILIAFLSIYGYVWWKRRKQGKAE